MAMSERVERELLADSCRAQLEDRYLWVGEGQAVLDDLRTRSLEALERWFAGDGENREVVRAFLDDYGVAMGAWRAGRLVVDAVDGLGDDTDAAREVIRLLDEIDGGQEHIWHDETLRIVGSSLISRRRLVSPVGVAGRGAGASGGGSRRKHRRGGAGGGPGGDQGGGDRGQ